MYASRTTQFIVGIFGVIGIVALAILSFRLGQVTLLPPPGYTLYGNFDNVSGLKSGDSVEIAGVEIGKVFAVALKKERARVALRLNRGVQVDKDAIASIKTSGIIGGKYVSIAPGPSDRILVDGETIRQTESAFVLEDAIGQLINSSGTGGDQEKSAKGAGKQPCP